MGKLMPLVLLAAMFVAGCSLVAPATPAPANHLPIACIDSISPLEVPFKGKVTILGHGTDRDGDVVAYMWRSDIDGEISTSASFETSSLSEGTHAVYFKVQDDRGSWSEEVYRHVKVFYSEINQPVINSFSASHATIFKGDSVTLSWDISGAATVTI